MEIFGILIVFRIGEFFFFLESERFQIFDYFMNLSIMEI